MQEKTVTFTSACKKFQFTVKESFFKKRWNYNDQEQRMCTPEENIKLITDEDVYCLMTKMNMKEFLHCELGPAIVYLETNQVAYYKEGKQLSKEEGEKLHYDSEFSDYAMKELGI